MFSKCLIRLYLNFFLSLLNEINLKEIQQTFFRRETEIFAYDLMFDFCLNIDINYLNTLFSSMKFPNDYTTVCYKIVNRHSAVTDLT